MTHALNLTIPIRQDEETLKKLADFERDFETKTQGVIAEKLKESRLVHFARVVVIGKQFIQVITEYEGSHEEYTEWFRKELKDVFADIFALADGPTLDVGSPADFWRAAAGLNVRSLGMSVDGSTTLDEKPAGYLFSAYGGKTVEQIQDGLGMTETS